MATVIRAGTGLFYGHVPLLAVDFTDNPAPLISFFDPSGALVGGPILLRNAYLPVLRVSIADSMGFDQFSQLSYRAINISFRRLRL